VGWLDLVAVKYSAMVNGTTGLAPDACSTSSPASTSSRVCTAYEIDGERVDRFLPDGADLARAKPVFQSLPGFKEPIGQARKISDLPAAARNYIDFIQNYTKTPMAVVSVGPDREQTMIL
jgi:adenylosuccinate synthase